MRAMVLDSPRKRLEPSELPEPEAGRGQLLLQVLACGVCRTDLHVMDGDLPEPKLPLVLGHELVGRVIERGPRAERFVIGDRVGVPWWAGRAAFARTAARAARTFATPLALPAITLMAASLKWRSRMSASVSRSPIRTAISKPRRFSAPA